MDEFMDFTQDQQDASIGAEGTADPSILQEAALLEQLLGVTSSNPGAQMSPPQASVHPLQNQQPPLPQTDANVTRALAQLPPHVQQRLLQLTPQQQQQFLRWQREKRVQAAAAAMRNANSFGAAQLQAQQQQQTAAATLARQSMQQNAMQLPHAVPDPQALRQLQLQAMQQRHQQIQTQIMRQRQLQYQQMQQQTGLTPQQLHQAALMKQQMLLAQQQQMMSQAQSVRATPPPNAYPRSSRDTQSPPQHANVLAEQSSSSQLTKEKSADIEDDVHSSSSPLIPCIGRDHFVQLWSSFQEAAGVSREALLAKVPHFAGKPLDVYLLFVSVLCCGGVDNVQKKKLWKTVMQLMGVSQNISSASFHLYRYYQQLLSSFEDHYRQHESEWHRTGIVLKLVVELEQSFNQSDAKNASPQINVEPPLPSSVLPPQPVLKKNNESAALDGMRDRKSASDPKPTTSTAPRSTLPSSTIAQKSVPPQHNAEPVSAPVAPSTKEPINEGSKTESRPVGLSSIRKLDTAGGVSLDLLNRIVSGQGEAKTRRLFETKEDYGVIKEYDVLLSLKCGLFVELMSTLRILLILSFDESCSFSLAYFPSLLQELLLQWNKQWPYEVEAQPHMSKPIWTYSDLYELERIAVFTSSSLFFHDYAQNSEIPASKDDICMAISTILRNLSFRKDNQQLFASNGQLVSIALRLLYCQPSFDPATAPSVYKEDCRTSLYPSFLAYRKTGIVILQNIGLFIDELDVYDLERTISILLDFIESGRSANSNLPSHALVDSSFSDYSWIALDVLAKITGNPNLSTSLRSLSPDIISRCTLLLLEELPFGNTLFKPEGPKGIIPQRWYEMVTVQTALLCLLHLAQLSAAFRRRMVAIPSLIITLSRLISGLGWANTPVYIHDAEFTKTVIGTKGLYNLMHPPPEDREKCSQLNIEAANLSCKVLHLLSEDESFGFYFYCRKPGFTGGTDSLWDLYDCEQMIVPKDSTRFSDCEYILLGLLLNPKLPETLASSVSVILYRASMHIDPPYDEEPVQIHSNK